MEDFSGAKIYKLFPQHVVAVCLQRDVEDEEITEATKFIGTKNFNIFDNPQLKSLREFVEDQIKLYVKNVVKPRNEVELRLTTSWARLGPDDRPLVRFNSYVSGVLYLRAKKPHDIIRFYSNKQPDHIFIPTYAPDDFNTDVSDIGVEDGYLFLFPSRFAHKSVLSSDGLYIGFNTFPAKWIGDAGEQDSVWIE